MAPELLVERHVTLGEPSDLRVWAAIGICPLAASRRCLLTAISSRIVLAAGNATALRAPPSTGTCATRVERTWTRVLGHHRLASREVVEVAAVPPMGWAIA
jgi:hypothetical protein